MCNYCRKKLYLCRCYSSVNNNATTTPQLKLLHTDSAAFPDVILTLPQLFLAPRLVISWCWWWGWLWWPVIIWGPWPGGCSCCWFLFPCSRINLGLVFLFASMLWYRSLFFLLSAVMLYPNFLEFTPFRYIGNYFCFLFLTPISSFVQAHVCGFLSDLGTIVYKQVFVSPLSSQCPISYLPYLYSSTMHPVSPLPRAFANIPALHFLIVHYHNRVVKPVWLHTVTKKTKSNQPQLVGQLEKMLLQLKQMWQSCGQARECSERANLDKPRSRALANSLQNPWPIISNGSTFSIALHAA